MVRKFPNTWKSVKAFREKKIRLVYKSSRIKMVSDFSTAMLQARDNMQYMSSNFSGKIISKMESYSRLTSNANEHVLQTCKLLHLPPTNPFLRTRLQDVLDQNNGVNQEKEDLGSTKRDPVRRRGKRNVRMAVKEESKMTQK